MSVILPVLGLLLLGLIDFGQAYYLTVEVQNAAEAGALYGTQNQGDIAGMQTVATNDAANVPGISAAATVGCECDDGSVAPQSPCSTTAPPSCTKGGILVNYVQVNTTATYNTLFHSWLIPGLPATIALKGSAKLRQ
jgi:Flp pilus assembly protein TadG